MGLLCGPDASGLMGDLYTLWVQEGNLKGGDPAPPVKFYPHQILDFESF